MKPHLHARTSARKYGGSPEDYFDIHTFIDSSKAAVADARHRSVLHNAFGCYVVEAVFGVTRTNSEGKVYSPRDVAEDHIIEDLGFLPTLEHWIRNMAVQPWMSGGRRLVRLRAGGARRRPTEPAVTGLIEELRSAGVSVLGERKID